MVLFVVTQKHAKKSYTPVIVLYKYECVTLFAGNHFICIIDMSNDQTLYLRLSAHQFIYNSCKIRKSEAPYYFLNTGERHDMMMKLFFRSCRLSQFSFDVQLI
jgi:hypothetical protein